MNQSEIKKDILALIGSKSKLKRDVFELSKQRFSELKQSLAQYIHELAIQVEEVDPRLEVSYQDMGDYYAQVTIAGDTLVFALHTNIFFFPNSSRFWESAYLKENPSRGYCGIINVYNFLADSVRFNRGEDSGYLVARLFLNSENHFFVEGKMELGLMFNAFINDQFTKERMVDFVTAVIRYSINFDLFVPHYQNISMITLNDANRIKDNINLKTGKRLGFQFGLEDNSTE
jgi:hypothetical protein